MMPDCGLETSVPEWVIEHPETLAVFEELNIDYSCAGKSLEFACEQKGLDPRMVLSRLHAVMEADAGNGS